MSAENHYPAIAAAGSNIWLPSRSTSATLIGWYEVRPDLVTVVSGAASQLNNRVAGGANPLVQPLTTSSQRPVYEPTGWDGVHASLLFNGTTNFMTAAGLAASFSGSHLPITVIMAMQILTIGVVSGTNRAFWSVGNTGSDTPFCAATILDGSTSGAMSRRDDAGALKQPAMATALTTVRASYTWRFLGAKCSVRVNGTLDTNLDGTASGSTLDLNTSSTTMNQFSVGCAVRSTASWLTNMRLGGALVFAGTLSDAECAKNEKYLNVMHPL